MKRFAFRLERLLELRRQAERRAEQALAESRRLSQQHQDQLAGTHADIATTCAFSCEAAASSSLLRGAKDGAALPHVGPLLESNALLGCARRLELLRAREATQSRQVAEAERQVGHRRQELLSAFHARNGLSRLRDRRRAGHEAEVLRAEDAVLNEAATVRFARRLLRWAT